MPRKQNVFILSATPYGPEDKFTGHLAYLFDNIPELGQAWLDHLRGGVDADVFVSAGKHADGNQHDMPDFLMRGEREDVICEHKLDATLGPAQLERYLDFCSRRERYTRLAFITASLAGVAEEVLGNAERYLRPSSGLGYFRWEELYPIVAARSERLAREFTSYMEWLGLRACDTREWSDLFSNVERVKDFTPQWAEVLRYFRAQGHKVIHYKRQVPAVLIKDIEPWLPQLYLRPSARPRSPTDALAGPFMTATIGVDRGSAEWTALGAPDGFVADTRFKVLGRAVPSPKGKAAQIVWRREYLSRLEDIVNGGAEVMKVRLRELAVYAIEDAMALARPE